MDAEKYTSSEVLNKTFYTELFHILGLSEKKAGNKKLISREKEDKRQEGSFLENTIQQLMKLDKLPPYNGSREEWLSNTALDLVITWLNRILFLKLLEGRLVELNEKSENVLFLNSMKIRNYQSLNRLFFDVLPVAQDDRAGDIKNFFPMVPCLNDPLFKPAEIEKTYFFINRLEDRSIPVAGSTILKDVSGSRFKGDRNALAYLFDFLNSYDFGNGCPGSNKNRISGSVLGLIFEKINGYREGSYFTPGFLTGYMCREAIRRVCIRMFNREMGWQSRDVKEVRKRIEDKARANRMVNSLKICDPAVGSGHFLVSALNEIIALKSDLGILLGCDGDLLEGCRITVVDDELKITDKEGRLFQYNPKQEKTGKIQEAIFHEKQNICENCLYGVDVNPRSVDVCRMRLRIEILKSAYYKNTVNGKELETLPGINLHVKYGDSLVSVKNMYDGSKRIPRDVFNHPFEWPLAFPEVFDRAGGSAGFDIIVGNPPYIGEKDNSLLFNKYKMVGKWSRVLTRRTNLYHAFLIQSLSLINKEGSICLIVPNDLLTSDYATQIRKTIIRDSSIESIEDFGKNRVFQGIGTTAMIFSYTPKTVKEFTYRLFGNSDSLSGMSFESPSVRKSISKNYLIENEYWRLSGGVVQFDSRRMVKLDYYGLTTQQGLITGCNTVKGKLFQEIIKEYPGYKKAEGLGIYILTAGIDIRFEDSNVYINNSIDSGSPVWKKLNNTEKQLLKPLCTGKDIHRYCLDKPRTHVIWLNKDNYSRSLMGKIPSLKEHLDNYRIFLINRNARKFIPMELWEETSDKGPLYNGDGDTQGTLGKGNYYLLQKYAYGLDFEGKKILWQSRGGVIFYYSDESIYGLSSINFLYYDKTLPNHYPLLEREDILLFVSAVLNSELYCDYYKGNNNTGTKIKNLDILRLDVTKKDQMRIFKRIAGEFKKLRALSSRIRKDVHSDKTCHLLNNQINKIVDSLYRKYG
ncbi:MAG: Eco57I restriction-modification methylase domain-containing protein [Spirochaetales bacterium]|nr:Eco57I restriction-modification methylase domain-containing protein [Spirochaetales bacterium]